MVKRSWNRLSIQTFIALAYTIVIIILISLVAGISYTVTSRTIDENTNAYVFQLVRQIDYDIEYYLRNIDSTMNSVVADEDVRAYFFGDEGVSEQEKRRLGDVLSGYMVSREDIINIFLARSDGELVINAGNYTVKEDLTTTQTQWYQEAANTGETVISGAHIQNLIKDRYKWVVSWSVAITDPDTESVEGVVLIDLNFNLIEDMLENLSLGEKGYMFIIDSEGRLIHHPKHELIYSGIKSEAIQRILASEDGYVTTTEGGRIKHYIVSTSDYSGWKVVGAVYDDELKPYDRVTRQIYFLIAILAIILAVILSILISRHYLHPIKDLSDGMDRFKKGDLDTRVQVTMENELGDLAEDFNDMTVQIKRLVVDNQQKEMAKRKHELWSLQSQINPHFLYNTLDSIVWMAEAGLNEDVVKMTFSLSKLFRISINRGSQFVTLEQEIEHIESYLSIQKLRYGEKLDYKIDVEPGLLNYRLIKIIIQPIVENAIYHGIKPLPGPGFIRIHIYERDDRICIEVQDNGVGMDEATVKRLLATDGHNSITKGGIGVRNVDQRIKLYYGEVYGVSIQSEEFEGTTITLTLPKDFGSEEVTEDEA